MQGPPLIVAEDNLIAVTLPGGFVAVYEARLPFKAPLNLHLTQWTRPLFVLTMLVVGVWQYKRTRSAFLPCPVLLRSVQELSQTHPPAIASRRCACLRPHTVWHGCAGQGG